MSKPSDVIKIALGEVGYKEKASNSNLDSKTANAGSNNYTKYGRDLYKAGYYNGNKNGYEWCDQFADWCFFTAYGPVEGQRIQCQTGDLGAGCGYSMNYYKNKGRFDKNPKVGDQIFFRYSGNSGADHTGIVVEVTSTKITTVEGNSDNSVKKNTYNRSYSGILGYGHPLYSEEDKTEEKKDTKEEVKTVTVTLSVLKYGSTGDQVKTLQRLLKQLGYKDANGNVLKIDGDFGSKTECALKKFQASAKLDQDGVCGSKTWNKLLRNK